MIKNFFNLSDFSKNDIFEILKINLDKNLLHRKNIGFLFEKNSTRTRLSFAVGVRQLGGDYINLRLEDLNISREETFEDTFKAMNCYLDGLIYRTTNHEKLLSAAKFFEKPIINALSNVSHPCQILSDLFSLKEHFGHLDLNILWIGDMNNVCFSLVEAVNLIAELKLIICTPLSISFHKDWKLNSNISIVNNLNDVELSSVKCVMTDVFISMNDDGNKEKIELLKPYCVNSNLMSKTDPESIFMHCLPAKVGYEVSDEVFRGPQSIVWRQAYNRMVAQKKLLQFIYQ